MASPEWAGHSHNCADPAAFFLSSCEEASPHSCRTLGAAGVQVVVPRGCPLSMGRRFGGCAGEHGAGAQQAIPWIRGEQ